ncbi:C40 family peptidase [Brachybacterium sp. GU-2]|uniref:C40 family peptidase n=1 Tax=Brachybacterium sp. GU-2 TaxID=3069708 RepID=UPI00298D29DE|nr:C40 family peptidase [Brachybacterium sp. GU-2]WME23548.2 C40 family peptidase [Brachybacterium sp. GU-2]
MLPAVAAPAVGIPAAGGAEDAEGAGDEAAVAALAPAAGTAFSVEVGPTAEEIAAAEAAEREAAEQAAQEQAEQEQAEQEQAEQEQAEAQETESADEQAEAQETESADEQTETREDDSAETSSRSNEREEPAEDEQQESSSDDSRSSERSESSSSEEQEKSAPAPSAAKGSSILATARSGIGTPYVYGGTSPSGWDCSGFVQWVYAQHGISLPRGAGDQAAAGTVIPRSEARPGDLVYKPGHIGIYAGGNQFVDAGNSRVDTSERNIYSGSWTFIRIGG